MLIVCGLRPGEAFGLTWDTVDLTRRVLAVRRAVTFDADRRPILADPKTDESVRSMPIPPELAQVLSEHREATRAIHNPLGLVFPNIEGELIHPNNWSKRDFRRATKAAGLPASFRLYDLRHSCATLMLDNGVHPKIVAERLGHSTTKLTLDTYSHVTPTMQGAATQQLAGVVYATPDSEEVRPVN